MKLYLATLLALSLVTSSHADIISLNFDGASSLGTVGSDTPTEATGVIAAPASAWINLSGNSATNTAIGAGSAVISFTTGFTFNTGGTSGTENHNLMDGAIRVGGAGDVNPEISGLSANYTTPGYDVYVYFGTDAHNRVHRFTLTPSGGSAIHNSGTEFSSQAYNGTFTATDADGDKGNYMIFSNITASGFTIADNGTTNGKPGITGIQIVSNDNPLATTIKSFTVNDHYVTPSSQVAFSWETSNATTITIDQGVGDVTNLSTDGDGSTTANISATTTYTLTATSATGSAVKTLRVVTGPARPNILFFMVDDMGWQDTSVPFHTSTTLLNQRFRTPNMEALAANGRKFTQAYACAVCSPSRTSLMTGLNAASHKVTNWTLNLNTETSGTTSVLRPPSHWNYNGLNPTTDTHSRTHQNDIILPRLLQQAGYRTIHAGKAHFGASSTLGSDPLNLGFDVNIAGHEAGGPGSYLGTDNYGSGQWHVPGLELYHGTDTFLSEALTLEINKSIEQSVTNGQPFFAYMAHYAVHIPLALDTRFDQNYPTLDTKEKKYATLVEGMDKSLGDIITKIDSLGEAENTLVIFYSDNGGISFTARGQSPYGGINTHNWPLRAGKGSAYEGGTRVPFIAAWAKPDPNNPLQQAFPIPQNTTCTAPVIIEDLMPTVLNIAGLTKPSSIEGYDISGYIKNTPGFSRPDNTFLFHYPHVWTGSAIGQNQGYEPHSAMRDGDWKIIYLYHNKRWELYNLPADIAENNNLADMNPVKLMEMARKMIRLIDARGGQYPESVSPRLPIPLVTPDLPNVDADNDGISDNTEDSNQNGLVDPGETDPDNDNTDGDNISDGDEAKLGTDPLDGNSYFYLIPDTLANGTLELTWPSKLGATFSIRSSINLTDWSSIVASGIAADAETTSYSLGIPSGNHIFYRVVLE